MTVAVTLNKDNIVDFDYWDGGGAGNLLTRTSRAAFEAAAITEPDAGVISAE